jgi:hypothetical protein
MRLVEKPRASDLRLGATVLVVAAVITLFIAWRIHASGHLILASCGGDRHPQLCEIGRWMLELLNPGIRHIVMALIVAVVAALFVWMAWRLLALADASGRAEEAER